MSDTPIVFVQKVTPQPGDVLLVLGAVNGHPLYAKGWTSWTRNYWEEQPPDLDVGEIDKLDPDEREAAVQAHRDACEALRRPMTAEELRAYCEQLLLEAAGHAPSEELHVEPILD